jgi:hypothetical protein
MEEKQARQAAEEEAKRAEAEAAKRAEIALQERIAKTLAATRIEPYYGRRKDLIF